MNCIYHVNTRLTPRETHIPFDAELSDKTRTELRCPIILESGLRCSCVALDFDAAKTDKRKCYSCSGSLASQTEGESLMSNRCSKCKKRDGINYRRRMAMNKTRRAAGAFEREIVSDVERAKRMQHVRNAKRHV